MQGLWPGFGWVMSSATLGCISSAGVQLSGPDPDGPGAHGHQRRARERAAPTKAPEVWGAAQTRGLCSGWARAMGRVTLGELPRAQGSHTDLHQQSLAWATAGPRGQGLSAQPLCHPRKPRPWSTASWPQMLKPAVSLPHPPHLFPHRFWAPGQPDSKTQGPGGQANCVEMKESQMAAWSNASCTARHHWICKNALRQAVS